MQIELLREWKSKLRPLFKEQQLIGFNGIGLSDNALEIRVVERNPIVEEAIMDILEKAGADFIPYSVRAVGKNTKQEV